MGDPANKLKPKYLELLYSEKKIIRMVSIIFMESVTKSFRIET